MQFVFNAPVRSDRIANRFGVWIEGADIKTPLLGDVLIVEHKALTELDDVHALIHWLPLEAQLNDIHNKARGEKA